MSRSLLLKLPQEIRDHIYKYVFQSPTGYIVLQDAVHRERDKRYSGAPLKISPFDADTNTTIAVARDNDISLKLFLLRTCRQVHDECKNVLWSQNVLRVQNSQDVQYYTQLESLQDQLSKNLQHVTMVFDFGHNSYFTATELAFQTFVDWAWHGALKRFDLVLGYPSKLQGASTTSFEGLVHFFHTSKRPGETSGRFGRMYLELMRHRSFFDKPFPPRVAKRLFVHAGLSAFETAEMREWLRRFEESDPSGFTKELHKAFGGELWTDGVLCYKDGVKLKEFFEAPPDEDDLVDARPDPSLVTYTSAAI